MSLPAMPSIAIQSNQPISICFIASITAAMKTGLSLFLALALKFVSAAEFDPSSLTVYGIAGTCKCITSSMSDDGGRVWVACATISDAEKATAQNQFFSGLSSDILLLDMTTGGSERRRVQFGSPTREILWGIDVNWAKEEIFVTGATWGSWDNEPHSGTEATPDAFLTKYKFDGTRVWTRLFGTNHSDHGRAVAVDPKSDVVYVAGWMNSTQFAPWDSSQTKTFVAQFSAATGMRNWIAQPPLGWYPDTIALVPNKATGTNNIVTGGMKMPTDCFANILDPQGTILASAQFSGCEVRTFRYDAILDLIVVNGWIVPGIDGTAPFGVRDGWVTYFNPNDLTRIPASIRVGTDTYDDVLNWAHDPETRDIYLIGSTLGNLTGLSQGGAFMMKFKSNGEKEWVVLLGNQLNNYPDNTAASIKHGRLIFGMTFMDAGAFVVHKIRDPREDPPEDSLPTPSPTTNPQSKADQPPAASESTQWVIIGAAGAGGILLISGIVIFAVRRKKKSGATTSMTMLRSSSEGSRRFFAGNSSDW